MSKDPLLCAPCRVGDHRSHNEDGCANENNFNSECECPVTRDDFNNLIPDFDDRPWDLPDETCKHGRTEVGEMNELVKVENPYPEWQSAAGEIHCWSCYKLLWCIADVDKHLCGDCQKTHVAIAENFAATEPLFVYAFESDEWIEF